MTRAAVLLALAAGCTDLAAPTAGITSTEDDSVVLDGFFPIAADYQSHESFDKWQARGINTVIRVPPVDNIGEWTDRANALGLKMIREPKQDPRDDLREPNLLAWHWMDEPELHGAPAGDLESFRQRMHGIDPRMPISVNFWGGGMRQGSCFNGHCYRDYIDHADWISDDIYACNNYSCDVRVVGQEVHQLREWAHDHQRAFAYIETSTVDDLGPAPSPRRFAAEVWDAVIHGARGVFYFSEKVNKPCASHCLESYDATPNDVVDEMKHVDAQLTRLAPVLQRGIDPDRVKLDVPDALETTWRYDPGHDSFYFFVLNPYDAHHDGVNLHLHGVRADSAHVVDEGRDKRLDNRDTIHDDFAPYELHIYEVPNS